MIRVIDASKSEYEYIHSQVGSNIDLIDYKARNSFYEESTMLMLKCIAKFNH